MNNVYLKKIAEKSLFKGRIIEVIENKMEWQKENGQKGTFEAEIARRTPGVRALILDEKKGMILLNKEKRPEIEDWDYRLPGGKVFDKLDDYLKYKDDDIALMKYIEEAVVKETEEECRIVVHNQIFLHKSVAGSSVIWDLFYYLITDFSISKRKPENETDEIIDTEWFSIQEVIKMCIDGVIQEDRSVAVLLRYLLKN